MEEERDNRTVSGHACYYPPGPDTEPGKCPVCGHEDNWRPYRICPVCDWERDPLQEEYPNYSGGANVMSLNEAKKAWKEDRKVE